MLSLHTHCLHTTDWKMRSNSNNWAAYSEQLVSQFSPYWQNRNLQWATGQSVLTIL